MLVMVSDTEEAMSQTTVELKQEIHKTFDLLRTLRDEARVNLHLAGMDAKSEWQRLEPRLTQLEARAGELTDATRAAADEVVKRLRKLRASLH